MRTPFSWIILPDARFFHYKGRSGFADLAPSFGILSCPVAADSRRGQFYGPG